MENDDYLLILIWVLYFWMIIRLSEQQQRNTPTDRPQRTIDVPCGVLGLSREQSARYIGISPSLFDQLVKDGRMPKPKRINARTVWDRRKLDEAFDALDDDSPVCDPWDEILT
jgi:predicted DNA-binding transcriptional regulator AlpA